ncbi:MAG: glutamate--cysteine ligase [Pseudomonadales bacterium]|tara:strand:- start:1728 stop:3290 length:1563 start_codon:yes stop_codon:yes gene_type:complete
MPTYLQQRLQQVKNSPVAKTLGSLQCGIEKEGLRVGVSGRVSHKDHPKSLGSSLTHGSITTDYSEALLEYITPVFQSPVAALDFMQELHSFSASQLHDIGEYVWPASMPCYLDGEEDIRIANFGSSNTGKLKHTYRVGLAWRYGKIMQSIAGLHFNFSPQDNFWPAYQQLLSDEQSLCDFQSSQYFSLIRNFRRHSWVLLYLFGASPALDASFVNGRDIDLEQGPDGCLVGPYATSLRMSDLGYNNKVQSVLNLCFNDLDNYAKSLEHAISTPLSKYENLGVKVDGGYRQLNANLLQIENEYYSDIRPKRVTRPGQKPVHALKEGGVEYVEVRNIDLNPFLPLGIDAQQSQFINAFLTWCLFSQSPVISDQECEVIGINQAVVVRQGRKPGLMLQTCGGEKSLQSLGLDIITNLRLVADVMPEKEHVLAAISTMEARLKDASLTPSAQVLAAMEQGNLSHHQLSFELAQKHQAYHLQQSLSLQRRQELSEQVSESIVNQERIEAEQTEPFDDFLAAYLAQ